MKITAKDVNTLRSMTGAGMMDCKKALVEAHADFEKAIEILREKGRKVSALRSDKETKEGSVFTTSSADNTEGVLIALNCETDFVAKNTEFQSLGQSIVETACSHKVSSKEELLNTLLGERTVQEKITELVGKIGEKIALSKFVKAQGEVVTSYIHAGGKLGVLISLKGGSSKEMVEAGKNVGMQIAAMNPIAVDENAVDQDVTQKELKIAQTQALAMGKPENMVEKIATGKLKKFYQENTLIHQPFIKDNSKTVAQYLESVAKGLNVVDFHRIAIG